MRHRPAGRIVAVPKSISASFVMSPFAASEYAGRPGRFAPLTKAAASGVHPAVGRAGVGRGRGVQPDGEIAPADAVGKVVQFAC